MRLRDENGMVMVSVMCIVSALAFLLASVLVITSAEARITVLERSRQQAYWLAIGQARVVLRDIEAGRSLSTYETRDFPNGKVQSVYILGAQAQVLVTAQVGPATSTVAFTYNESVHKVMSWQENYGTANSTSVR